ncbi:OLC1v1000168C1 [Oldenlandia corymbosa var. corymbosa]|uniref:OLC1v1000168C1 n=1 Tax=Oldenlandia corymbosa var. corymbosa TaxID=529605 RepID=A0AAV1D583_OLDCO|nr:OLC1v1000168C1 [Oldenlandia corymbosa var. corymbosa]
MVGVLLLDLKIAIDEVRLLRYDPWLSRGFGLESSKPVIVELEILYVFVRSVYECSKSPAVKMSTKMESLLIQIEEFLKGFKHNGYTDSDDDWLKIPSLYNFLNQEIGLLKAKIVETCQADGSSTSPNWFSQPFQAALFTAPA